MTILLAALLLAASPPADGVAQIPVSDVAAPRAQGALDGRWILREVGGGPL